MNSENKTKETKSSHDQDASDLKVVSPVMDARKVDPNNPGAGEQEPDKEEGPEPEQKIPPSQPTMGNPEDILHFEMTKEGIQVVGAAIGAVVSNKYVQQTIFAAMNDNLKPVFKK